MRHTLLRDSRYLDFVPFMASVADVAVAVLLGEGHDSKTYDVTGGRLGTVAHLAAELSEIAGRDIAYVDETIEQAWESRRSYGAPDWEVEGWITSYLSIANGEMAVVSDTVARLAGQQPITLRELVASDPSLIDNLRRT
jgi:NAD(P)H dehydrogenase (quinone)